MERKCVSNPELYVFHVAVVEVQLPWRIRAVAITAGTLLGRPHQSRCAMVEIVVINRSRLMPLVLAFVLWPVAQTSLHSSPVRIREMNPKSMLLRSSSLSTCSEEATTKISLRNTKNLCLRGGASSVFELLETIDKVGSKTFGNGLWAFLKSVVGLGNTKEKRSVKEDLEDIQKEMASKKSASALNDRRIMYFVTQGPTYFLNPMVYLLRYVRGTEKQVHAAVVYLQDPPERAANRTMEQHLAALAAPPPEGFGLSRARIREALYRANVKVDEALLEAKKSSGMECTSLDGIKVRIESPSPPRRSGRRDPC